MAQGSIDVAEVTHVLEVRQRVGFGSQGGGMVQRRRSDRLGDTARRTRDVCSRTIACLCRSVLPDIADELDKSIRSARNQGFAPV